MAGQIIKRGEKTWLVRVFLGRDAAGKRKFHNKTVHGTKRDAERYCTKVRSEQQSGTFVEPSRATVSEYLVRWLDTSAKIRVRERTWNDYKSLVDRYIIPALGARKLANLQPAEIQRLYADLLAKGLSARTVRYVHSTLKSALNQAVRWGELARNPAGVVEIPRLERLERRVLSSDETVRFLQQAAGTRWYPLWYLLTTTGLRPGEALGLKWSDLDGTKLRVQRTLVWVKKTWKLEDTKTDRSRRTVLLPESTLMVLHSHRAKQAAARLARGAAYNISLDLMFATDRGHPLDYRNTVQRYFKPLLAQAGLPPIRLYDLRHTHATQLLRENIHPKIVSERLGHSSTVMTMDVYSHVLPDMQEEAATKVDSLLGLARQASNGGNL